MRAFRHSPRPVHGLPLWLLLTLAMVLASSLGHAAEGRAKYVFLFIGDGLAQAQRASAEFALAARQGQDPTRPARLVMNTLPVQGMTATSSLNSVITDSGAAGTALACGVKTYNGAIGVDGSRSPRSSVAELARDQGLKVGIVSSVSLDHATPASFYAHQVTRNNYYEIALDLAASRFDFFGGGGFKDPEGKKSKKEGDKVNALAAMRDRGYTLADTREAVLALKPGAGKVVAVNPALDADKAMPYALDGEAGLSLAEFTDKAVEMLDNPKGFFLMVEGGKIDWACHANDAAASVRDTLAFDQAVARAVEFAQKHPQDTLIVVTGDHECGGMALGFAGTRYGNYYEYLGQQKESFLAFSAKVKEYKKAHTPENARLEDLLPAITGSFGLRLPTEAEREAMKNGPKANEDVTSPADPYGLFLKDYEEKDLRAALAQSVAGEAEAKEGLAYLHYGGYEPLTVVLTRILAQKAGIGWTTYSHTGMPVPTSAQGPGAEGFGGFRENTDLAKALARAMGLTGI